jgi:hypothetical protein
VPRKWREINITLLLSYVSFEDDFDEGYTPEDVEAEIKDGLRDVLRRNYGVLHLDGVEKEVV